MKRIALYLGLIAATVASCSVREEDFQTPLQDDVIYYASFEQPAGDGTRVYANEDLHLRWTADDRVCIFGRNTYNQQYKFLGATGDNAGGFSKVDGAEYVTGNPISHTVSVYPYQEGTKISESEVITVMLPAEQHYAVNTFGLGDNTMVSVSEDNVLMYKNVGGYLRICLYGEGVSLSSILLKGNNGEKIAGKAEITMPLDGIPTVDMTNDATTELTLHSDIPVVLGSSAEKCTAFWFVLPPTTFRKGFSITVKKKDGTAFTKTTSNSVTISRNHVSTMTPFEVEMESRQPNNVIYYTTSDGKPIELNYYASFGTTLISNNYVDGVGVLTFSGDVTSISRAFNGCYTLTSVSLPESLTEISDSAFDRCSRLSSIVFSDGLKSIGGSSFSGCNSLTEISIPDGVTSIGSYAFNNCTGLTSVFLPQSVTYLGGAAFDGCSNLRSINVPESLTSIEFYTFLGCSSLASIDIPSSVTSIGGQAFDGCIGLTRITIPENVTSIGNLAFNGCKQLERVDSKAYIPPTIGTTIFKNTGLKRIYVWPESLDAYKTASGWSEWTDRFVGIGKSIIRYTTSDQQIITPDARISPILGDIISNEYNNGEGVLTIDGVLSSIGGSAFRNITTLTSIILPDSIISIDQQAFSGCSALTSISIPESVTSISYEVFYNCASLASIILPKNLTTLGSSTFSNCSSLVSVTMPDELTSISAAAFKGCSSLTSITIPANVTRVGFSAFENCSSLQRIDVKALVPPQGGEKMFSNTGLCPIYIPAGSEEAYANADYWKVYTLRMRVEGSDAPVAYSSTDFSKDGDVIQLQQATVGRGVNIIFMGDGFLDKDMGQGGKYEKKMEEAMEQFFAYEPYYSFRNRFNIYAVKVVSKNDIYGDESSDRALTYEKEGGYYFQTGRTEEYASKVPNPYNQPMSICTVCNTNQRLARSWCFWFGTSSCFVMDGIGPVLNHELGGHAFGKLLDEYVENSGTYSDLDYLDNIFESEGRGANVDWRSDPDEVRWSQFLKDSRYRYEGLGVYEGGYLYAHGVYRPTEDSMMNSNTVPFNAPSREQIYKFIMRYSEGEDWVYDYEEFANADERGRMEAAEELGPWKSPQRKMIQHSVEESGYPPLIIEKTVKEVGIDKDGHIVLKK